MKWCVLLSCLGGSVLAAEPAKTVNRQQLIQAIAAAAEAEADLVEPQPARPTDHDQLKIALGTLHSGAREHSNWQAPASCSDDPLTNRRSLCDLRWRKGDALSDAVNAYNDVSRNTKSRFIGSKLADHLEVDGDGVRFQFDW